MKTTGERIRQAREKLGWTADVLAQRTGYKTQSGISNLENRATGKGGNKIHVIAHALGVSVDWLMNGPDADRVPFIGATSALIARDNGAVEYFPQREDPLKTELLSLFSQLDEASKREWVANLRGFVMGRSPHTDGLASYVAGKK